MARWKEIAAAVSNSLGEETAKATRYLLPDEFIEHLKTIPRQKVEEISPLAENRRGCKVKRKVVQLSAEELRGREQEALRLISETLRGERCKE